MQRYLPAIAALVVAGCVAPAAITGGSSRQERSFVETASFPPYPPAYPQRITESPATRPLVTREVVFYPPVAPVAATVTTATTAASAATQPSATGDERLLLRGGAIAADGSLGGFSASSVPVPEPRSGWWVYLLAVSLAALGVATFRFVNKGVGLLLIALAPVVFLLEPLMLTVLLVVLAVLATLVAVYFAYRHGRLQRAVGRVDAAFAGFVAGPRPADPHTAVQASLNDDEQAFVPNTVAAAKAVSPSAPPAAANPPPARSIL